MWFVVQYYNCYMIYWIDNGYCFGLVSVIVGLWVCQCVKCWCYGGIIIYVLVEVKSGIFFRVGGEYFYCFCIEQLYIIIVFVVQYCLY